MEQNLDERKLDIIKFQILDMETENTVKKESNPAIPKVVKQLLKTYFVQITHGVLQAETIDFTGYIVLLVLLFI